MFPILKVEGEWPELYEQLGSKPKFWYTDPSKRRCLFKECRQDTGEDWSEKIAAEIASSLGLPHATYELAEWQSKRGVVTPTFVPEGGRLVFGNELLSKAVVGYSVPIKTFHRRQHTIGRVVAYLRQFKGLDVPIGWLPRTSVRLSAGGVFVGYLLLDALISNQDRHDENWGIISTQSGSFHLAPTYDHASCLGRNESDASRKAKLMSKDRRHSVEKYVERSRSALYLSQHDKKPLGTMEAFERGAKQFPLAAGYWLDALSDLSMTNIAAIWESMPLERITDPARQFANRMLELNRTRLLEIRKDFG